jgi:subtilisin family serine protease
LRVANKYGGGDEFFFADKLQIVFSENSDPAGSAETVRDEFNAASFNNNDGTSIWSGDWVEDDPEDVGAGPTAGAVQIIEGELRLDDQPDTRGEPSAARRVDLSGGYTSATFSFDFRVSAGVDLNDAIAVEISTNGGQDYTLLEMISWYSGAAAGSKSYDISDFISGDTTIRLRVANKYGGGDEFFFADNLQIAYGFPDTFYPTVAVADQLHAQGTTGAGVTVAVLDTGYWSHPALDYGADNQGRVLAQYDAILDQMDASGMPSVDTDENGHGTHVTSVVLSRRRTIDGKYNGVAPHAGLVSVKAFNVDGAGNYMDVIRGIDWVVANQEVYDIRVLNLSFSAEPQSYYFLLFYRTFSLS